MAAPGVVGIRVRFHNPNDFEQGFRIYRAEASFDEESLPPVYETLPPLGKEGMVSWVDDNVNPETDYYYMASVFYKDHEFFTTECLKASAQAGPLALGEHYGGGIYIGNMVLSSSYGLDEGTYAIIMGGPDSQVMAQWKTANSTTAGTDDTRDGLANTLAMMAAGDIAHPAAKHCREYDGGGFGDWYLPAKDELNLVWVNSASLGDLAID